MLTLLTDKTGGRPFAWNGDRGRGGDKGRRVDGGADFDRNFAFFDVVVSVLLKMED